MGRHTTSRRVRLTRAVSRSLATANKLGSRFVVARSMLSSLSLQRAPIRWLTDPSHRSPELSKSLVTMLESTGRSAMTAVVITELFSEGGCETDPTALGGPTPAEVEDE